MEARRVTDQFEWSSLARLSPSFTHEWSWARQCVDRIKLMTYGKVRIEAVYLRAWADDAHMCGCPFVMLGDEAERVVNIPHAAPVVLALGDPDAVVDPHATIKSAWPSAEIYDEADHANSIAATHRRLVSKATRSSRAWGLAPADRELIAAAGVWPSTVERDQWLSAFARMWSGTWRTELITHRTGDTIGWSCLVHRDGHPPELAAAITAGRPVHRWMSLRLQQSTA